MRNILFTASIVIGALSFGQSLEWFTPFAGAEAGLTTQSCIDNDGNAYLVGNYTGAASVGTNELNSSSATSFLIKVDPSGQNLLWKVEFETNGNSVARKIAVDNNGNVGVVGDFSGDLTIGSHSVKNTNGDRDIYVAYFDSSGNPKWLKSGGGDNQMPEIAIGVDFDNAGNLYAAGNLNGFEGEKISNAVFYAQTRTSNDMGKASFDGIELQGVIATYYSTLVVKIGPNGDVLSTNCEIQSGSGGMGVDGDGNVYVGGGYINYSKIFGKEYSSSGSGTSAVIKINASNNLEWMKAFGAKGEGTPGKAPKAPVAHGVQDIKVSENGNIAVLGSAMGPVYDRAGEMISSKIKSPVFWVMHMDNAGNVKWFGESVTGMLLTPGCFDIGNDGSTYVSAWALKGGSLKGNKFKGPAVLKINPSGQADWIYEGKITDKKKKYTMTGYSSVSVNNSNNSVLLAGGALFQDIKMYTTMQYTKTRTKTFKYNTLSVIK